MKLGQGCRRQTPRWCWMVMLLTISATVPGAAFIAAQDKPVVSGKPLNPLSQVVANEPLAASPNPAPNAPQMVKIYALRSLLEQARRDLGENDANVRQVISDQLRQAAKPRQDDPQLVVEMQSQIPAKTVVTSEPPSPSLVWSETDLMIDTTADAHQRIAERLAEMGESGLVSIQVETRLITGPTAAIDRISAAWSGLGQVAAKPVADLPHPDRIEGQLAPTQPRIYGYAQTTIEKNVPVNCAVASPELLRTIVNQSQADARSNIMFAPRVTVFSGQPATIEDAVIRPFVVGRQTAEQGAAPVVRLYKEGWILNVRPMAVKNDRVRLNLRLVRSEILDVQTARLTTAGAQPEMMVQIPEQSVTKIQTVVELQPGQSILMGGLQTWVPTLSRRTGSGRTGGNDAGPDTNPREPFLIVVSVNKVKAGSGGPPAALKAVSPAPDLDDRINIITPPPALQNSSDDAAAPLSKPKPERVADPAKTVLETRVYSVADLVIPVLDAKLYREPTTDTGSNTDATEAKPDFAPLKDLIVKTIAPDSWDQNGGPGALRSFDSTLSLVVRQTAAIHEEVQGLLSQIRSLQDIQVSFGVERLTLVPSDFQTWLEKIDLKTRQKLKLESGCLAVNLCGPDADSLRRLAGGENRGPALKITLMNGQQGELQVAVKDARTEGVLNWLQLTPSVSPELQRLRMNVAGGMADRSGHLAAKRTAIAMLNHGDFLLVDLATETFPEVDSGALHPILKQLPYAGALFKKSNSESPQPAAQRQFFLLTPKIVVVREETEEKVRPQPEKAK